MSLMFPVYFISLVLSAGLSLLSAYQILELSDLDCDYINPQRCCANLNRLVVPEILCVSLVVVLHLLTLNWIPVATTSPVLAWLVFMYRSNPRGYVNLFDSTNICDNRVLNKHVRHGLFKVIFHLLHFLGYMYLAIFALITVLLAYTSDQDVDELRVQLAKVSYSMRVADKVASEDRRVVNLMKSIERMSDCSEDEAIQPLISPSSRANPSFRQVGPYCFDQSDEQTMWKPKLQATKNSKRDEIDGHQAWLTLACIFVINASTFGSLKVYGLIFEEIVTQNYYNREEASWPISTASTIQNLAGLLTPLLALKISWRSIEVIQTLLLTAANVGAYFSQNLALDILCLGIVQGVALSLRYNMNIIINNEYFLKYRATAMGVSLAGSTCGVFVLKPIITYVIDTSNHNFRNAYLALGIITSFNIILNLFIRKPHIHVAESNEESSIASPEQADITLRSQILTLIKNPNIHCIWVMQTIYFYISRTFTIFIVDYGIDKGFNRADSRDLLNFWVYGEIAGRLLLGGFVDSRLISLKWNIVLVNILLALSGVALLLDPSVFDQLQIDHVTVTTNIYYFWYFGISVSLVAALSSLVNILIVPFGQEYLGKKNVPWAYAISSFVTSFFLLLRPTLIGLSRDQYKSYSLLIIVMSATPCVCAILFALLEPLLKRRRLNTL